MLVRSRIKPYLILGMTVALISGGAYFWGLRSSVLSLEREAQANLEKARNFEILRIKVMKQKKECLEYLAREEGNFDQFSFCRKFIEWADVLSLGQDE
ncbi:MAG: hypothetical protein A2418_01220 [Candidatus Brennerbacteria bacterium RIFOXYC1_FULL_41_11]|uniref:Uncharacterized protein n=1 Tax=Candidatus Brennerbacteria bacterium RIFOXYD1_FULL_41_16 TaxID=1797529 RepID=A0A1G1XKF4_9BACT|nr:MAG: hypothetical protein UU61_C0036G0025 [Parcubacteria group bacterium GW2011_GWB1_41_4]OGY38615.1 MAG: hypothetical protein A2391_03425 [Candidatus Brennerbacteria bacterium RIFOXYB1_FULL_41_13]OGY39461.1 MAG: hypothetical protein A2418_01220 [Candidatus Brennerbacteria bacterium RIFOXYC1_FULL_41_11]OGY40442.1 MAG: hypothetical protein A2570_01870 [Candidatus Brennerbacteria bacterium RIFOXYD1_FULL_41_16]